MAIKVSKKNDVVADNMFCVIKGSTKVFYKPLPYFRKPDHSKNWRKGKNNSGDTRPGIGETLMFGFALWMAIVVSLLFLVDFLIGDQEISQAQKDFNGSMIFFMMLASFIYAFYRRYKGKLWSKFIFFG